MLGNYEINGILLFSWSNFVMPLSIIIEYPMEVSWSECCNTTKISDPVSGTEALSVTASLFLQEILSRKKKAEIILA